MKTIKILFTAMALQKRLGMVNWNGLHFSYGTQWSKNRQHHVFWGRNFR